MNALWNFVASNWQDILQFALLCVIAVIQIRKYGKVSKEVKDELKYRTASYREQLSDTQKSKEGQKFDRVVAEYALDESTGELYKVGTKDLQEIVQSSVDCALNRVLDKFGALPPEMQPRPVESNSVNIVEVNDDLLSLGQMFDDFEDIRERYHFDRELSYSDMFNKLEQMKIDFSASVDEKIKNQNSEVLKNEKKKDESQA